MNDALSLNPSRRASWIGALTLGALVCAGSAPGQSPAKPQEPAPSAKADKPLVTFKELNARWTNAPLTELRAAAEAGDATAQSYLAERLVAGKGVKQDATEALAWLGKAAEQGLAYAQCRVGWIYEEGMVVPHNRKLAEEWTHKAAEQGYTQAELNMGWLHERPSVNPGENLGGNFPVAAEWYEKAARKGNPYAQFQLAELYHTHKLGEGVLTNCIEWYFKAAEQGHVKAQASVGRLSLAYPNHPLLKGDKPMVFLRKAAEKGDLDAQWELARRCRGGDGVEKNPSEGFRWMKRASEHTGGDTRISDAIYELATMYEHGEGVAKNPAEAWPLYIAASGESPDAQFRVARMYEEGTGVEQDDREAASYFFQAAKRGWGEHEHDAAERGLRLYLAGRGLPENRREIETNVKQMNSHAYRPASQFLLGEIYLAGKIVDKDIATAVDHYKFAAKMGSAEAMNRLGRLWASDVQGQPDYPEAVTWYRRAAEQGFAEAQFNLGLCYAKGEGVTRNAVDAWQWLSLAEAQRFSGAEMERKKMEAGMESDQLKEAREKTARFKPSPAKERR